MIGNVALDPRLYDFARLFPRHIDFKRGGLLTSICAVLVCLWIFVDSPPAITVFVSVFGAILAPLFGIMMADYYLVKRQVVNAPELYTMAANRRYHYDSGWNQVGLATLAASSVIATGWELSTQLFKILPHNHLGWVVGAVAGAAIYVMLGAGRT